MVPKSSHWYTTDAVIDFDLQVAIHFMKFVWFIMFCDEIMGIYVVNDKLKARRSL